MEDADWDVWCPRVNADTFVGKIRNDVCALEVLDHCEHRIAACRVRIECITDSIEPKLCVMRLNAAEHRSFCAFRRITALHESADTFVTEVLVHCGTYTRTRVVSEALRFECKIWFGSQAAPLDLNIQF